MKVLVTGAAGFIGSTLTDALLARGDSVIGYDNLSTGYEEYLDVLRRSKSFALVRADLLDLDSLKEAMEGVDLVFHLAANADVRFGTENTRRDLEQNTIGTYNVLEAMRRSGVKKVAFSSTGSVYGETATIPTPEDAPFPVQTSFYGASKAAGEGLVSAFVSGFGMQAIVFRFVSILGPRYTHGHVYDFYKQLRSNGSVLSVLGNGRQRKSYLHVDDCVSAMLLASDKTTAPFAIYNLGQNEYCEVNKSIGWITDELGVKPELVYAGGERGWVGDNPFIYLDCSRMRSLGWTPRFSIEEGVRLTLRWLRDNPWVLDRSAVPQPSRASNSP